MSSPGIITYPLGGITYDAEDAAAYFAGRTSGVYSTDIDFAVAAAADGSTDLTVSAGQAWMHVSRWVGLSVTMREAQTLTLPLADSALPRIDRVVLRYDATPAATPRCKCCRARRPPSRQARTSPAPRWSMTSASPRSPARRARRP